MKDYEVWETMQKFRTHLQIITEMGFADMNIKTPDLELYPDDQMYFDPNINEIHFGVYMLPKTFDVHTEEDLYEAANYVLGHEMEHKRSTASRPYSIGIQKGCERVLEYISNQIEPTKRRFRKPADYEDFANVVLPNNGIYLNWTQLRSLIGGIANSIEDGRIERIRSKKRPGYENLRIKYRGQVWQKSDGKFQPYSVIKNDVAEKLRIILNQILSLATCQLYEKGFTGTFYGTPLMDEVNDLMPNIAAGYISPNCRGMSNEVIIISEKLAPYLFEVCKMAAKDMKARQMLENMISKMIAQAIESGSSMFSPGGNLSENEEKQDELDSIPKSTFPMSDLVITLPDDVYDKLMENAKESQSGNGLMIKREHPKKENPSGKKNESSNNGSSGESGENPDEKSAQSGTTSGSKTQSADNPDNGKNTGTPSFEKASDEDTSGQQSESAAETDSSKQEDTGAVQDSGNTTSDTGSEDSTKNVTESQIKDSKKKGGRDVRKGAENVNGPDMSEAVKSAMKDASLQTHAEAMDDIKNINQGHAHESHVNGRKEQLDKEPVVPESLGRAVGCSFQEYKREYKVTDSLPAVLKTRGNAMYRKNKRYFKSLSTPNVSNLDSGSIDPSKIYGLAFGDTNVFRKQGKDKIFDGCAYMLIDNSGSMSGNKRIEACKAGAVIEEGFHKMFPLKIVAFDSTGTVNHEVVKNWDEWLNKNCCWNFALHGRYGCGNEDGYDIQIATKELMARSEKHKMLVILSDGAPGDRMLVKKAVDDARKKGIEVYSIYFEEGNVSASSERTFRDMYTKDYVCCPLSELDENLIKLFKKFSRR